MTSRRRFLASASGLVLAGMSPVARAQGGSLGPDSLPAGTLRSGEFAALPGKVALIKKTWRPPNFETPIASFAEAFTPNDAFFVRYHLASIPEIAAHDWRLQVGGDAAASPRAFSLAQLRSEFETVELNAVCQCSGNRRGLADPHVPGVQWGYGAMGNARWRGVRLRDVLTRAGVNRTAVEVVVDGADSGVASGTPDYVKSIPVWKAMDENTLIALEMNGEPLPHWNGYPARLVVPGWTATYWMKHLTTVNVTGTAYDGFWMAKAYRIPKGMFPVVDRFLSQEAESNTPITEMVVNSLILAPADGASLAEGRALEVRGVAWDGGAGIVSVDVSLDDGRSWRAAELGEDLGRFAWRQWRYLVPYARPGSHRIVARATNRMGVSQTHELIRNPAGYHHNVMHRISVRVA